MGGADQWGNITAGLELIRRTSAAMTARSRPLTASPIRCSCHPRAPSSARARKAIPFGSMPSGTSPYAFYQYWLNTDDRDVGTYLRWFTESSRERVEELDEAVASRPEVREAQRALALDITSRVHGEMAAAHAVRVSEAAFSREPPRRPGGARHAPCRGRRLLVHRRAGARGARPLLVESGTFASNGEARRMISGGGVTVNEERVTFADASVPALIAGGGWSCASANGRCGWAAWRSSARSRRAERP